MGVYTYQPLSMNEARSTHWNGEHSMNVRKLVGLLAIALLIFFVIKQPGSAAQSVQNIGGLLSDAANSIIIFFTELV